MAKANIHSSISPNIINSTTSADGTRKEGFGYFNTHECDSGGDGLEMWEEARF